MAAQPGNKSAAKAKIWEQAIKRALARLSGENIDRGLDQLADKIVASALTGDQWAMLEIGNRMDGKPAQDVTLAGDADNPLVMQWPLPKSSLDQ